MMRRALKIYYFGVGGGGGGSEVDFTAKAQPSWGLGLGLSLAINYENNCYLLYIDHSKARAKITQE